MVPFMAEDIYRNLVCQIDASAPESVHLCDFPVANPAFVDKQLEEDMEAVLKIVVMGRAARNTANIKNRQPIGKMFAKAPEALPEFYQEIVEEELNVKALEFTDDVRAFTSYTFKYSNLVQNLFSKDISGKYGVSIWNFDISCFFYVLSIVVLLVLVSERIFENKKIAGVITLPAKYLFIHYVLHLAVLTAVYGLLAGKTFSVPVFCIFISLLMIIVYLVSVLLDRLYKKNYQGISPV